MPGILPDWKIIELCEKGMITPFVREAVRRVEIKSDKGKIFAGIDPGFSVDVTPVVPDTRKIVSYGVSGYGYDIRCSDQFKIFTDTKAGATIDPLNFDEDLLVEVRGRDYVIIPPNSFALASSIERFDIPRDVLVVVLGKSTYARCGLIVNCTPAEPEWRGHLTIELSNTTPLPMKVYSNQGIAQMLFFGGDGVCRTSYNDKGGKYQDQKAEIVLPKG